MAERSWHGKTENVDRPINTTALCVVVLHRRARTVTTSAKYDIIPGR